ncbi:hypothetical protein Tco_0483151, partial [Tanacetum coccineum]
SNLCYLMIRVKGEESNHPNYRSIQVVLAFLILFPMRSEGEKSKYPFFESDDSSSDEWRDYGMASDDYDGPPIFDDDQYEYVIEEEERFVGKGF